jgi:transcriptional regulator with XRE-family HTH domain
MTEQEHTPEVGKRLRAMRGAEGLSLRSLSERCGLSINAISLIERGESSPTVSSLHKLATALGRPIADFFEEGQELTMVLVRKNERRRTRGDGVLIESLGSGLTGQSLEPFLLSLMPGASSGEEAITHGGEEFVFCLEGEIDYQVDGTWHRLGTGDSLTFRAEFPHQCRNNGLKQAVALLVIQAEEEEIRLSQQAHLMTLPEEGALMEDFKGPAG